MADYRKVKEPSITKVGFDVARSMAKSKGYNDIDLYANSVWKGFVVFHPIKEYGRSEFPKLAFILVKGNNARWANSEENEDIVIRYE